MSVKRPDKPRGCLGLLRSPAGMNSLATGGLCVGWLAGWDSGRDGLFCECCALKREQAPSPQKQFCVKSGVAIQLLEEDGHFFFGLFVAMGAGGFQALLPGLAGCR